MDAALLAMRARGASWEDTAARIGVTTMAAIRRARVLGVPTARMNHGRVPGRDMMERDHARHAEPAA